MQHADCQLPIQTPFVLQPDTSAACTNPTKSLVVSVVVDANVPVESIATAIRGAVMLLQNDSSLFWTPDLETSACQDLVVSGLEGVSMVQ